MLCFWHFAWSVKKSKNPANRYRHKPARVALGVSMGEVGARAKARARARLVGYNVALKNAEQEGLRLRLEVVGW